MDKNRRALMTGLKTFVQRVMNLAHEGLSWRCRCPNTFKHLQRLMGR